MILEDADGLVCPEDTDNDRAHKYMTRTADEQNLEASDAFFARLIEEAHKRGIRGAGGRCVQPLWFFQ